MGGVICGGRLCVWMASVRLGIRSGHRHPHAPNTTHNHPNPEDVVESLPCPLLLMHGTSDALIPHWHSELLHSKVRHHFVLLS
jgi:fermentation-respiration switch protein FrsA (DUF1100 family)